MDGGVGDILALNELLTTLDNRDDYAQEQPRVASVTPASLAGTSAITVDRPIGQIQKADPKAIWQPEEVPSDDEDDDAYETRARPVFEILYKQSVMTEDVFLGLSDKDPSSAHCEAMVVRIECPRHRREDIELDVKKQKLLLQSATLKLALYLPYPVRPHDGDAKWDQRTQVLTVSLPIIRDEW